MFMYVHGMLNRLFNGHGEQSNYQCYHPISMYEDLLSTEWPLHMLQTYISHHLLVAKVRPSANR